MDSSYLFTQKRKEFGKPCFFTEVGPHLLVDIDPDVELKKEFYVLSTMTREVDNSHKVCAHEVNTVSYPTENSGMKHSEGGWPAGVDFEDEDAVTRFRKKIEKDKTYVNAIKNLADIVEIVIDENNSIDIYEEYFSGESIKPEDETSFRTINVLLDPNSVVRKVVDICWSENSSKLAAAYSVDGIENPERDLCLDSYVWDIENCLHPHCVLKPERSLNCVEFNPRENNLVLGGYTSGQIALWDIRIGNRPQQLSPVQRSHKQKITGLKWMLTVSGLDFLSTSLDGQVMSWDARNLYEPTERIFLDPSQEDLPNLEDLYTISCAEYDPSVPEVFMVGTEQGQILKFSRQVQSDFDKITARYDCENRPILCLKRNAFYPQLFASCDPWTIKIWSEVMNESPILNIIGTDGYYTDVDWSPKRASLLFLAKTTGAFEVWDIPGKSSEPMMTIALEKGPLCAVQAENTGRFIACGAASGAIHLLEVPIHFQTISNEGTDLVTKIIGTDEPLQGRSTLKPAYIDVSLEEDFIEDAYDPPETAEDLREEYEELFEKYPLIIIVPEEAKSLEKVVSKFSIDFPERAEDLREEYERLFEKYPLITLFSESKSLEQAVVKDSNDQPEPEKTESET
ncbi:dynein intermediate chain 3, ciliary [Caerostris darwini]|uniref:Dynein intermediate chain 3, ciliary n=1 Tax=Caerostris darwini TaxID=1538125 RepID=A0AAV4RFR5_9ARAC|nr:dynein intermediate chain 3, ciliary [Caerostris darwini]